MAFIDNQDENLDPSQNGQGPGQSPLVGQGSSVVSGGGGTPSSSAAGVGPGGTGGWTNIQAYLNANQGDTGSAQALNNTLGNQFGQERKTFQDDSSKFVQDAQGQADKDKVSTDEAGNLINSASSDYNYGMQPTDNYFNSVKKVQNALSGEYSGPKEYNYGFSDKTQQYGSDLGDNASFDSLMKNVYAGAAKSPLSSGQYQLQKQFDVNNSALGDTRKSLMDQYTQLGADRDKTVTDTTNKLSGIEQGYRENQNALKDYLTGQSNDYEQKINREQGDARSAYNKEYKTGLSGDASIGYQALADSLTSDGSRSNGSGSQLAYNEILNREGRGIWSGHDGTDSLTWDQLQRENDQIPVSRTGGARGLWSSAQDLGNRKNQLGNFYSTQDAKYADTAAPEKKTYNVIQDFLNSNAARKEQGFKVRS